MTSRRDGKDTSSEAGAPPLVAHRGYARHYPENTLEAVEAAWCAGARYVEVDVQLTSDGVPVLFHDLELNRTTGADGRVTATSFRDLRALHAGEPARLGVRFSDARVPALAELAARIAEQEDTVAFIEIKRESLEAFGTDTVLARVLADLTPALERCVLISSDRAAMARARMLGMARIGWVLPAYSAGLLAEAGAERPDFLFLNITRLPPAPEPLREGTWRWVLYEVDDAGTAVELLGRGADMIETMAIGELLTHPWQGRTGRRGG